ncbi:MAG: sodium-translocating pyrophosphatase [candidate division WOR-3 bacterium]|nr:sodium-translocating pyrophosphatase [candidate division WOR-3 bacterium]
MSIWYYFAPVSSIVAILFVVYLILKIFKESEGEPEMRKIAEAVREGATAYLKKQYQVVSLYFLILFFILLYLALNRMLPIFVPFAFITGGFFSGLSGFIGMSIGVRSSARTTNACKRSLNAGLRIAFSSGMVMGLVVVGLALLDLAIWYFILSKVYQSLEMVSRMEKITSTMLGFGIGASSQALFARVGGGIYTKAADVGADLVGKVEAGIPEDDPRNPAVIADNVGDNVGDIAGMGADLYESYVGSIVATMALSVAAGLKENGVLLPLVIAGIGTISSIVGYFFVQAKETASQVVLLSALRRGIYLSTFLVALFSYFAVKSVLGDSYVNIYWAILSGLLVGVGIGFFTEFFTSDAYSPTRGLASTATASPATVIIEGISVGMLSTLAIVAIVACGIICSFYLSGGFNNFSLGLYGIGISAVGMLSTLGITLASDAYGPVADNAGGNAEMSHQPSYVRERTDALDALGNTTAATGKGFAIGSAALTALALIASYREEVRIVSEGKKLLDLFLLNPRLITGIFLGAMLPYAFASMIMKAVGRAAQKIVEEVRRQFREIVGLLEGKAKPDYGKAVGICTRAAQKEMIMPALMAIIVPIIVGLSLGVEGVCGLLVGALTSGFVCAVMMANSGASWDNAKKYIEKGNFGGKGSEAHKAAVIGDTVGDPFKDAAGPSLNILIKLMSMISIVFLGFILRYSLFK